MDVATRLDLLLNLARDVGLEVRCEPLGGESGGLCVLRGRRVLFVDAAADADTRYDKTLAALAELPELDGRYLPPEIRADLAAHAGRSQT